MNIELFVTIFACAVFWAYATPAKMWQSLHKVLPGWIYQGLKCVPCITFWAYSITTFVQARSSGITFTQWVFANVMSWSFAYILQCVLLNKSR
jgi:hypothetical protein